MEKLPRRFCYTLIHKCRFPTRMAWSCPGPEFQPVETLQWRNLRRKDTSGFAYGQGGHRDTPPGGKLRTGKGTAGSSTVHAATSPAQSQAQACPEALKGSHGLIFSEERKRGIVGSEGSLPAW